MPRTGQPAIRHVAAVQRAVAVLEALAEAPDLGTNEIARRTGVNASTVSRLLSTLADAEFVEHVAGTGRYRLGVRLLHLGSAVLSRLDLREIARSHLTALTETTGETSTLSAPGETEAITVDYVRSSSYVQGFAQIGRPSVAHATAVGKVFLAHGGHLPGGELVAFTEQTITDRARLAAEVDRVHAREWADARGEREPDFNAIAAPVLDGRGELAAILGVQGPAVRFDDARMRAALEPLRAHAAEISRALGFRHHEPEETS
jgi:IclR family acetate operon transcriptional repressor